MSRVQRLALLGAAAAVLIAVFLITRTDDEKTPTGVRTATPPAVADSHTVASTTPRAVTATTPETPIPEPDPLLTGKDVKTVKTEVGQTVRFRARSQNDDEVHVHGYDKSYNAPAGKTITVEFNASMAGIFDVEFEKSGTEIGRVLVVE